MDSNLNDPTVTKLLIAVMVKRLGGSVNISQADIDEVAFTLLEEYGTDHGDLELVLIQRKHLT